MPGPDDIDPDQVSIEDLEAGRVLDGRRSG
jgi:hypothetical protein